jgi:hypothetical protein
MDKLVVKYYRRLCRKGIIDDMSLGGGGEEYRKISRGIIELLHRGLARYEASHPRFC